MSHNQDLPIDNVQHHIIKPPMLVDEVSETEYYIGVSRNTSDQSYPKWRIQRIVKTGNVWKISEYPNGDQSFSYVWANRYGYTYRQ
jgi:hypothetical protein